MKIAGLQKTSLIDFPGRISGVVFTQGCNFHCPYCHNPDLVPASSEQALLDPDQTTAFFESRIDFLEAVVVTGGEPTIQPGLADWCTRIKNMGYPLKLDTNGSNPQVLMELAAAGLLDFVAMDIKTDPAGYVPLICDSGFDDRRVIASIEWLMDCGVAYEFRLTCFRPLVDEAVMARIGRRLRGARRLVLQQCRTERVLEPGVVHLVPPLTTDELGRLCTIASDWVQECAIR